MSPREVRPRSRPALPRTARARRILGVVAPRAASGYADARQTVAGRDRQAVNALQGGEFAIGACVRGAGLLAGRVYARISALASAARHARVEHRPEMREAHFQAVQRSSTIGLVLRCQRIEQLFQLDPIGPHHHRCSRCGRAFLALEDPLRLLVTIRSRAFPHWAAVHVVLHHQTADRWSTTATHQPLTSDDRGCPSSLPGSTMRIWTGPRPGAISPVSVWCRMLCQKTSVSVLPSSGPNPRWRRTPPL